MICKKSKLFFIFLLGVAFSLQARICFANNLRIENFEVAALDEAINKITFSADISWDNSWRNTTNNDAIWVFVKYSTDGGMTWNHASMSANGDNPIGFLAPSNFMIRVPEDEKGFFLQRSDFGAGNVSTTNIQFSWDYAQDGLSDAQAMAANTVNKVFGIEMVYIARGAFYAGDGNSSSDYRFKQGTGDDDPWYIQSESGITTTNSVSEGYYYQSTGASGEDGSGAVFIIPESYPKGYEDFYAMKYELTEGQWISFFNTLASAQKTNRDITSAAEGGKNSDAVVDRNTVSWDSTNPMNEAASARPDRPVSYISWPDLLAYADWSGLRPLTELEYEKMARGKDVPALANEFVWGTTLYNGALAGEITPNADEDGTERISDNAANLNNNSLSWTTGDGRAGGPAASQKGPLRVGIFSISSSTTRGLSGGGFYGNMELAGNLAEMVVTVGRAAGRNYRGTHGDGELTTVSGYEGNATNSDWPGLNATASRGVTGTAGSGYRGGDFQSSTIRHYYISTRTDAASDADSLGYNQRYDASHGIYAGGRLGRTAP